MFTININEYFFFFSHSSQNILKCVERVPYSLTHGIVSNTLEKITLSRELRVERTVRFFTPVRLHNILSKKIYNVNPDYNYHSVTTHCGNIPPVKI